LCVDKIPNVVKVVSNSRVKRIVNQDKQLQRLVISADRYQLRYIEESLALFYLYVSGLKRWSLTIFMNRFVRYYHVDLDPARGGLLLRMRGYRSERQSAQRTEHGQHNSAAFH
jgi:hypothetical protein